MTMFSARLAGFAIRLIPICGASVSGFTIAHIGALGSAVFLFWLNRKLIVFAVFLMILLGLKFLTDQPDTFFEWGKSAALFGTNMLVLFGVTLVAKSPRAGLLDRALVIGWRDFLITAFALHGVFLVGQYVAFEYLGSFALLNPLQGFSPPGPDPSSSEVLPYNPLYQVVKRPNGLAWEPSVAALWQLCGLALLLAQPHGVRWRNAKLLAILAGTLATQSVLGDIMMVAMLVHHLMMGHASGLLRAIFLYPVALITGVASFGLLASLLGFSARLAELSVPGTSGYLRYLAPLQLLEERGLSLFGSERLGERSFRFHPLFEGLDSQLSGISNLYFEVALYFGAAGIVLLATLLLRLLLQQWRYPAIVVLLLMFPLFGGYLFNTLGFYPLFSVMLVQSILARPAVNALA
ncbi:MAG: hypothetical protein AB8B88_12850 [Devosiaceae bacterium]